MGEPGRMAAGLSEDGSCGARMAWGICSAAAAAEAGSAWAAAGDDGSSSCSVLSGGAW